MNRPEPKLGIIAIAVCLVATSATAAEFKRTPQADGPDIIAISGVIEQNDDKKFAELTWGVKDAIVVLNSRGGYINAATNIGLRVRSHNYETRLHSGAICNSACTLIWLAGSFRHLDRYARLGFHSAATTLKPPYKRSEPGNAMMALYMANLGVPQQVIDLQPKADPCCFNYINNAQAKAWGLLGDRPTKQQQALPTPETQRLPTATTPTSPKIEMLAVRPVTPSPEPAPSISANDRQPAGTYEVAKPNPSPEPAAKVEEPPIAARPTDRFEPGRQQAPAATAAQKVVLYEEDPADPNGKRFVGSAIWRTEIVTARLGQPPELAIRADIEVPERKLAMTWSLRRNTDKGLPATHTVEIMFRLPWDFPAGGISNVPGILMKQAEQTRGVPLAGLAIKVTPGFYMIGLSNLDVDKERNLQLLMERGWFDIPVVYNNNHRAILAMEKGSPGERAFADAFKAWKQ